MKKEIIITLIIGVFGIIGSIIGIVKFTNFEITINTFDDEQKPLTNVDLTIKAENEITRNTGNESKITLTNLTKKRYVVMASKSGYSTASANFNKHDKIVNLILPQLDTVETFSLKGWTNWGGLTVVPKDDNSIAISGSFINAGYVTEFVNKGLLGDTLLITVRNSAQSKFSDSKLFKMTFNSEDSLLRPVDVTALLFGEYVPVSDRTFSFILPDGFDGKLGFVFNNATLNNLELSGTLKKNR